MVDPMKLSISAGRMGRMADRLEVDLGDAIARGQMSPQGYRSAVMRCTKCSNPEGCEAFLAERRDNTAAPEYCENLTSFAALKS